MHATCVEDLQVFQRARALAAAIFALTQTHRSEQWLSDQLADSAESIMANISEGFCQSTDRAFARYLVIAAGSAEELRVHVQAAEMKGLVRRERAAELTGEAREIANMLTALIRYLHRCDRKDRLTRIVD